MNFFRSIQLLLVLFVLTFIMVGGDVHRTCADTVPSGKGILSATFGVEGHYKNGFWTPITVLLANDTSSDASLELTTVDSDGTPTQLLEKVIIPSKNQSNSSQNVSKDVIRQTVYFPLGKANGQLTIRLLDEHKNVLDEVKLLPESRRKKAPLSTDVDEVASPNTEVLSNFSFNFSEPKHPQRPLYLLIGDENIGLNEAFGELRLKEDRRPQVEKIHHFTSLPDHWIGYEAVEMVIISTTAPTFFEGVQRNDPRICALIQWIRYGGRVLLLAGKDSHPLTTGDGPLTSLIPGKIDSESLREIRIANALTQYVPKAKNLVMTGSANAPFLNVPILTDVPVDSMVRVIETETPLLVQSPLGLGAVTFFAGDLSKAPFVNWSGRSGLLIRMLGYDQTRTAPHSADTLLVQLGYSDLSGQIRSVMDQLKGVQNIPFSIILLLGALYILVIGPGDWFLTHRLLQWPNATWITFPCYILLFCGLAVWLGHRAKPNEIILNRIDLIDYDQPTGIVRGTSWGTLYSPRDTRYNLKLVAKNELTHSLSVESRLSWLGLQGSGLGGMAPKTISPRFWDTPYQLGQPQNELIDLPVQIRSTKSLVGRWVGDPQNPPSTEKPILQDDDGIPVGTVTNPLNTPLENAILLYGRWAIHLGTLLPGEGVTVSAKNPRMERYQAIGTIVNPFEESTRNRSTRGFSRYNTESTNIFYIFQTMMFYNIAGGRDFIGLDNSLHHYLDLSEQIYIGRAALFGTIDDEDSSGTKGAGNTDSKRAEMQICSEAKRETTTSEFPGHHCAIFRMTLPVGK